jgi:uracil-DNA glycosylase
MLVEQSWLEALPGEFQIFAFKCSASSAVYPPAHLIFNALNTTPFHYVKAVILGQEGSWILSFLPGQESTF